MLRSRVLRKLGRTEEAARSLTLALRIPPRDLAAPPSCVDLTASYNAGLTQWLLMPPELDLTGNDLASVPTGLVALGGVDFDARGVIQTARKEAAAEWLPMEVRGIRVGSKCQRFHFLHTASWDVDDGTLVGKYVLHYEGGGVHVLPLVMGEDILEFWYPSSASRDRVTRAVTAWTGTNQHSRINNTSIWLYRSTWENPLPDAVVECVDIVSTGAGVAPVVVAITVE